MIRFGFAIIGAIYVSAVLAATSAISLNGRIWITFALTCSQFNDVFAYLVGMNIGRTPLISLSPNKTLEGFAGGAIVGSLVMAMIFPYLSTQNMACPMMYL